jgi:hypothetical protein
VKCFFLMIYGCNAMSIFLIFLFHLSLVSSHSLDFAHQALEDVMIELHSDVILAPRFAQSLQKYCFFSAKTSQPHIALEQGLRFFTNTAKRIPGFQSSVIIDVIGILKEAACPYMRPTLHWKYGNTNSFDLYREGIQNCLVTGLSTQFDLFKKDPNLVLNQLALELAAYYEEGLAIETVRQTIIQLIDLSLSKAVWSLHDQEKNWLSINKIAHLIVGLIDNDVIVNIADVDDLLWTLTERYSLFLDLVGGGLSDQCYAFISDELNKKECIFNIINEQNSCMYSKVNRLKGALNKAYATKTSIHAG